MFERLARVTIRMTSVSDTKGGCSCSVTLLCLVAMLPSFLLISCRVQFGGSAARRRNFVRACHVPCCSRHHG